MLAFASLAEWSKVLRNREISAVEAVDFYLDRIAKNNDRYNAYTFVDTEGARAAALQIDARRTSGEELSALAGIPFGVKEALCVRDMRSTASAKILDNYVPPFDATVIARLRAAGAIPLGKQNCDAFGHGASNENSDYGPVKNPWNTERVAGGSSGGSGAAVAADLCAFAIGEDTGGSVRAPAAFCGITGYKVSYGRNSRYGCMPMSSSLDSAGPMGKSVADVAQILQAMAGQDVRDATSAPDSVPDYAALLATKISGKTIGLPAEYFTDELNVAVREKVDAAVMVFTQFGARLKKISLPHTKYAVSTYYILVPCEDSSNLMRMDGIRYGVRQPGKDLITTYENSRTAGLPDEVKRRIMIGTFALSHGYYDAYYRQAQKMRTLIKRDFDEAFKEVDVILTPTMPETAFALGAKINDPLKMYLSDIFSVPVSLAGLPALSVPCGLINNLPVGLQIIGPRLKEEVPLNFGWHFQAATKWHAQHPNI